jgi:hypothetical protein
MKAPFVLVSPVADAHQQLNTATEQTITLAPNCIGLMLGARGGTGPVSVVFDDTAPSATNGLAIVVGANPVYVPVGYLSHGAHKLRALGGAGSFLDVLQLM